MATKKRTIAKAVKSGRQPAVSKTEKEPLEFIEKLAELLAETKVSLDDIAELVERLKEKQASNELAEIAELVNRLRETHIAFGIFADESKT